MTHHPPPPTPRPNWRDPNMPVIAVFHQATDDGKTQYRVIERSPDEHQMRASIALEASRSPSWRFDPTYNLRRPRS